MKARLPRFSSRSASRLLLGAGALWGTVACGRVARADDAYVISIDAPAAKAGSPATATVHIKPGAGRHMNPEFPTSISKLTANAEEIDLPKKSITAREAGKVEETEAQIIVAYTPKKAGKKTFSGLVNFAVCTASSCDPQHAKVNFDIDAK